MANNTLKSTAQTEITGKNKNTEKAGKEKVKTKQHSMP